MIALVDYGMGNLGSLRNMLRRLDVPHELVSTHGGLRTADGVILPGVGAFDRGMEELERRGLLDDLEEARARGCPFLGICLGMQLLGRDSEEGDRKGLGWIDAHSTRLSPRRSLPVPHVGWSDVQVVRSNLLVDPGSSSRFYFVHSYQLVCADPSDVILHADYGGTFVAGVESGHLWGVQFHPEKSHRFGLELFRRFSALVRSER